MAAGIYQVNMNAVAVTAAISLIQLKAGTAHICEILRAWCSQSNQTTSAQQRIQILRKTVAATVTSFTPIKLRPGDATAGSVGGTAATGTNASVEGTDGDILIPDAFNVLNGWLYIPTPEERIVVEPGGIVAIKFPAAPGSSMTVTAGLIFREVG